VLPTIHWLVGALPSGYPHERLFHDRSFARISLTPSLPRLPGDFAKLLELRAPKNTAWQSDDARAMEKRSMLPYLSIGGSLFSCFSSSASSKSSQDQPFDLISHTPKQRAVAMDILVVDELLRKPIHAALLSSGARHMRADMTPLSRGESRPSGMLIGACFNKRRDAGSQDSATNVETIFGSYYLFEALNVVGGTISASDI
jgi:hypothetical protein